MVNCTVEYHTVVKKNKEHLYVLTQKDVLDLLFFTIPSLLKNQMKKTMQVCKYIYMFDYAQKKIGKIRSKPVNLWGMGLGMRVVRRETVYSTYFDIISIICNELALIYKF